MVLFVMLYKVVLTFESVDEIIGCIHSILPLWSASQRIMGRAKFSAVGAQRHKGKAHFFAYCLFP